MRYKKITFLYKQITLPYQIFSIIILTALISFYFSLPHLDKPAKENTNKCEVSNDQEMKSNYYQMGEFNRKDKNSCQKQPQWPMLPTEK